MNEQLIKQQYYDKRTTNTFLEKAVSEEEIKKLYELTALGATAFNSQPARFLFLKTPEAKLRLKPFLSPGNIEKTMKAPVVVIVATDFHFYNLLPVTFPVADVKPLFTNDEILSSTTALRNATMAGAYLIKAAHILGLDTGAMSGFDNAAVDKEFFYDQPFVKSNFLINMGYANDNHEYQRLPRLQFEQAAKII